ncbi:MAG: sigma-70 family RNA polymerase sigma factor [Armatimonadetes bacterium]|nr:sigma-70 family RNA polymerase sigma factor [Armatimonadota bacterium]NIO96763.1 sigma-70 family RNA polymerase sigma factor [Armatimonadota bacterium]
MQNEESLVQRAKQHDQAALTQLYEENFDKIYRYIVLKIGDRTEAEDMTQQVFLKAFKSISGYKSKGNPFSSWLFRIAHNQVVDYWRKKSKRATVPLEETLVGSSNSSPGSDAERKMDIESLVAATKRLTGLQREVVSLRFAGGLSVAQVAKAMGKSEGAIKALQHSAIISLRKMLATG